MISLSFRAYENIEVRNEIMKQNIDLSTVQKADGSSW